MDTIKLGVMVHYVHPDGEVLAAIVTQVHNATCCNLHVYDNGSGMVTPDSCKVSSCVYSDQYELGTWHNPDDEGQVPVAETVDEESHVESSNEN